MKASHLYLFTIIALAVPAAIHAQIAAQYTPVSPEIGALPGFDRIDAQTFTASIGGTLDEIDLAAQSFGAPPSSIEIALLRTSGGVPVGGPSGILGTVVLPGTALPGFGASSYLTVDFSSLHIALSPGAQYAIATGGASQFGWLGTDGGYLGGSMFSSSDLGANYTLFPTLAGDRDLAFRVLVAGSPVPEANAAPVIVLVAGAVCGYTVLRKKRLG